MSSSGIRRAPEPFVMTICADMRCLIPDFNPDDSDPEREPGWEMTPLVTLKTLAHLRRLTVEDLKKHTQCHMW